MTARLRFLHVADIHLGSILHFSSNLYENLLDIANNATYDAFKRICSCAIEKKVDFILISGDLYDKEARSVRASRFFINQCLRLKENNIKVYLIYGNHDPLNSRSEIFDLPENVLVFSSDSPILYEHYNLEGTLIARIVGQSYRGTSESRKMHSSYKVPDTSVFNIGMLHTQLENNNKNYVPSSITELKENRYINYWALGHIHKHNILNKYNPAIVYPGIPQGRDFGEEGSGGIVFVEVDEEFKLNIEFIQTSIVAWNKVYVNISENEDELVENLSDLEAMLIKKAEDIRDTLSLELVSNTINEGYISSHQLLGVSIQWIILGRGKIHDIIVQGKDEIEEVIIKALNDRFACNFPFIWSDSVVFKTTNLNGDINRLLKENYIFKEVDKIASNCLADEVLKINLLKVIGNVWEYSNDHENYDEQKLQIEDSYLQEIIDKAKQLVYEKLLERGGY